MKNKDVILIKKELETINDELTKMPYISDVIDTAVDIIGMSTKTISDIISKL